MKLVALLLLAIIPISTITAQKKDVTKEETIEYLDKKCKEAVGHMRVALGKSIFVEKQTLDDAYFRRTVSGVELFTRFVRPNSNSFVSTSFNPRSIVSITDLSDKNLASESPIGTLEIKFVGKIALSNMNGDSISMDRVYFSFLKADPENAKRIEKAILRLKDFYRAEEASF